LEALVVLFVLGIVSILIHSFHEVFSKETHRREKSAMNFTFDWNEMFMIISTVLTFLIFWAIRKYFHPIMIIVIWIFNLAFLETIDYFLAATPYDLYYFGDNSTYEASTALIHVFLYPSFSMIFLFFYDKFQVQGRKLVLYILFWTVVSIFYEWLCIKNNVLVYTGWKLIYSIPFYPVSSVILIAVFHISNCQLKKIFSEREMRWEGQR